MEIFFIVPGQSLVQVGVSLTESALWNEGHCGSQNLPLSICGCLSFGLTMPSTMFS